MGTRRLTTMAACVMFAALLCAGLVGCGDSKAPEPAAVEVQEQGTDGHPTADEVATKTTNVANDADTAEKKDATGEDASTNSTTQEYDAVNKEAGEQPGDSYVQDDDVLAALGDRSSAGYVLSLSNGLGARITSLRLRVTGDASYGTSLLHDGREIATNEVVRLYVPRAGQDDAVTYDVKVQVALDQGDERELEFVAALAPEYDSVTLRTEADVAFVDYITTSYEVGTTKEGQEVDGASSANEIDPNDIVLR